MTRGVSPNPFTQRYRLICNPGSSPSHAERMTPCSFGVHLQDRSDRRVDFSIQQHDVFAVAEGFASDTGSKFDRPGDVDEHVHLGGAREQEGVLGRHHLAVTDRGIDLVLDRRRHDIRHSSVLAKVERALQRSVIDAHEPHAGRRIHDVVGEPARDEASADQADADRPSLPSPAP